MASSARSPATPNLQPRSALLDFIADFANWDNSTVGEYLDTSRALAVIAHTALTNPDFKRAVQGSDFEIEDLKSQIVNLPCRLVVDPFAGVGSIPLETLCVGADAMGALKTEENGQDEQDSERESSE